MEEGSIDLKRLLQEIIIHAKDPDNMVSFAAKNALADLNHEFPDIYITAKSLNQIYFEQYLEVMAEKGIHIQNNVEIKSLAPSIPSSHHTSQANMKIASFVETVSKCNFPVNTDGLVFGILSNELMEYINSADWKLRTKGIEEIEKYVDKSFTELTPFLSSFIRLLMKLLYDPNFKIVYTTMQIMAKILKYEQLPLKMDVGILFNGLVERLGDNKIAIRHLSYTLLRSLFKLMKGKEFLTQCIAYISSTNWHIRECILNLISMVFIEERILGFNKSLLIEEIIKLLDDNKPKVSLAAFEALVVISIKCGIECLNDYATTQLAKEAFDKICDRVEAGTLPNFNEDGMIDYTMQISTVADTVNSLLEKVPICIYCYKDQ